MMYDVEIHDESSDAHTAPPLNVQRSISQRSLLSSYLLYQAVNGPRSSSNAAIAMRESVGMLAHVRTDLIPRSRFLVSIRQEINKRPIPRETRFMRA